MKARIYLSAALVLFSVILLIVLGFVWAGANSSPGAASFHQVAATQVSPLSTPVADVERIPTYPGSVVQRNEVDIRKAGLSTLTLWTSDGIQTVSQFYEQALSRNGWQLFHSSDDGFGNFWTDRTYLWTEHEDSPWHLDVLLTLTNDPKGGLLINILYGRVPDIKTNMPVYSDAQQVAQTESDGSFKIVQTGTEMPAHIITKTYLTSATLNEIEQYYNSTLPDYGWYFFDRYLPIAQGGPIATDKQTGSLSSDEGLYFKGSPFDTTLGIFNDAELFITASPAGKGLTRIQLRAFVIKPIGLGSGF